MITEGKVKYVFVFLILLMFSFPLFIQAQPADVLKTRRQKLAKMVEKGIVIVQSTERNQNNLHEFFIPNSDNHDFIYFTGLETPNATLVLCPGSVTYPDSVPSVTTTVT